MHRREPVSLKLRSWICSGYFLIVKRRWDIALMALIVGIGFMPELMAQEARVRGFFTRARDLLIFLGPAVTIGSIFWGGANVLRERPAGKQWTAAAIFLALTILSGVLQDWWQ